ncbi:MAG: hydrogenase expression/formation protein HypE [Bacteroidales bacterium]
MDDHISLDHGSGGKKMHELIRRVFIQHLGNPWLEAMGDAAVLEMKEGRVSFTTDSYVVDPLFFPGGDIGKLAICGTVNDLAVTGALPRFISAGFILEEGLPVDVLGSVVRSMAETASRAGVQIVTGDTKVVNRGKCDKLFINTAGLGILSEKYAHIASAGLVKVGDHIIISGHIGDHGMAILSQRKDFPMKTGLKSDCAPLNGLIATILERSGRVPERSDRVPEQSGRVPEQSGRVRFMRDPTRGGVATTLCELVEGRPFGVHIREPDLPLRDEVLGMCEMFGFDPLYVPNEGKVLLVVDPAVSRDVLEVMHHHPEGKHAAIIGEITGSDRGRVILETATGGSRIVHMLTGEQLPRIC